MAVYRTEREPFAVVSRQWMQDEQLTSRARGLLAWMLSMPPDWSFHVDDMRKRLKGHGRDTLRKDLRQLEAAGYVHSRQRSRPDGTFLPVEYHAFDVELDDKTAANWIAGRGEPSTDSPAPEFQGADEPETENPGAVKQSADVISGRGHNQETSGVEPETENPGAVKQSADVISGRGESTAPGSTGAGESVLIKNKQRDRTHSTEASSREREAEFPDFEAVALDLPDEHGRRELEKNEQLWDMEFKKLWHRAIGWHWKDSDSRSFRRMVHVLRFWTREEILEALKSTAKADRAGWKYFRSCLEGIARGKTQETTSEAVDLPFVEKLKGRNRG